MRRNLTLLCLMGSVAATLLLAQPALSADLSLFQRYFGTIDYTVAGTGKLRGTGKKDQVTGEYLASKSIALDFPRSSTKLVGAFLYWQTHEIKLIPSASRAYVSYPSDSKSRVKVLGKPVGRTDLFDPCWNTGGTGGSTQDKAYLRMYRADILRYLEDPATGEIPTQITARFSDGGGGNGVTLVEGASIVLIYRHPALSFKSIVIYDGTGTMVDAAMTLDMKGFDQASPGLAKVSLGIGNGDANFSEQLFFNGQLLETNPFQNGWDNKTYDVSNKMGTFPDADSDSPINTVTATVAPFGKADCLSLGFAVFMTTTQDSDEDGWLDIWERRGVKDLTTGAVRVDLPGLGAKPLRKDLFVEIDYMFDDNPGKVHEHWPWSKALEMVGEAYKMAPVDNPDGSKGINLKFDIRVRLPDGTNPYLGNPYVFETLDGGGDRINERSPSLYCGEAAQAEQKNCPFPGQPGSASWLRGFQRIKNTYFDDARLGIFHYVVFGHQLALKGPEAVAPYSGTSHSGIAHLPGDSVYVALGRWRSSGAELHVGSANQQAAVLMHELGHNAYLFHGGITLEFSEERPINILDQLVPRPNCNNKQSTMSYLFLTAGLINAAGEFKVNYSGEVLEAGTPGAQDEAGLRESLGLAPGPDTPYRLRWYAPIANVQNAFKKKADGTSIPLVQASRYCDGSNKTPIQNSGVIRVDGQGVPGNPLARIPIDWNRDGATTTLPAFLDINFNGKQDTSLDLRGFNDWKSMIDLHGLQQVGMGQNLFGLSLGVRSEHLLKASENDLSENDLSENDLSENDLSENDLSENDLSENDLSENDLSENDLSEIDETLATAIGGNGPTALTGTLLTGPRRVLLTWSPPAFGGEVLRYLVFRKVNAGLFEEIGTFPTAATPQNPFIDNGNIQPNNTYSYLVFAEFAASPPQFPTVTLSWQSNTVSITP